MRYVSTLLLLLLLPLLAAACRGGSGSSLTVVPNVTATPNGDGNTPVPSSDPPSPTVAPSPTPTPGEDGSIIVACNALLAPVDKLHRLASDCVPNDLVELPSTYSWTGGQRMTVVSADALIEMLEAAADDGFFLYAASSYRSYQDQVDTYNMWVARLGQEEADRQSARPGHSEHQLGTTTDLTTSTAGGELELLRGTPEAQWLADNSWKFGFIVSYPSDTEDITGYVWEPWHVRFVGVDLAADVHESGLTLHEYLLQR